MTDATNTAAGGSTHCLWAVLIACGHEVFPLLCPTCGGQVRTIAFITFSADVHKTRDHIGVDLDAPRTAPARGPPRRSARGVVNLTGEATSARRDGVASVGSCVCGLLLLLFRVATAAQIPEKSDW